MGITASEAKHLSDNANSTSIQKALNQIEDRIKTTAMLGGQCVNVSDLKLTVPQWRRVRQFFEGKGFKWKELHDQREPDAIIEVSW